MNPFQIYNNMFIIYQEIIIGGPQFQKGSVILKVHDNFKLAVYSLKK